MYVGLDISKKETVGVWMNKEGEVISEATFSTDETGLGTITFNLSTISFCFLVSSLIIISLQASF